mmetsp:Transcript_17079/g.50966  ORF Transcript_17079/g.50966 Transcript_17079/m.50966 type:complete len:478 (+) Transcript_17079:251-1684(+)
MADAEDAAGRAEKDAETEGAKLPFQTPAKRVLGHGSKQSPPGSCAKPPVDYMNPPPAIAVVGDLTGMTPVNLGPSTLRPSPLVMPRPPDRVLLSEDQARAATEPFAEAARGRVKLTLSIHHRCLAFVLESCGGRALAVLAQTSVGNKARAERQAPLSLRRLTTLHLLHPAVAAWGSVMRLLSVYTDPPNLLALFVTDNPLGRHAVPQGSLLPMLCRGRTDYDRPDHRAFALKCALRFGDAAFIESCLLRMTPSERLQNALAPGTAEGQWVSSYSDAGEFEKRFARCRLRKTAYVRARPRPAPIPLETCADRSAPWRDARDARANVRWRWQSENVVDSDTPVPSYLDGTEILLHFVRLEIAYRARHPEEGFDFPALTARAGTEVAGGTTHRFFPTVSAPWRLARLARAIKARGGGRTFLNAQGQWNFHFHNRNDENTLHELYKLGAPNFWPRPPVDLWAAADPECLNRPSWIINIPYP